MALKQSYHRGQKIRVNKGHHLWQLKDLQKLQYQEGLEFREQNLLDLDAKHNTFSN